MSITAKHFGIPLRTMEAWEADSRTPPYIPRLMSYQWEYEKLVVKKKQGEEV
ncbi:MAG: hypothetical protein IJF37_05630 [Lachnospiraceae bacterium]|nr:hypothetical protein [Lachnospiraceae bacterium]